MFGWHAFARRCLRRPPHQRVAGHMRLMAWFSVALTLVMFVGLDIVLTMFVNPPTVRMTVRWTAISACALLITAVFSNRNIRMVASSIRRESIARGEAEALAELAALIAAGRDLDETLQTAVRATANLFGGNARSTIALPDTEGRLVVTAWSHPTEEIVAAFPFRPGEGGVGRAYAERRLVGIPDLDTDPFVPAPVGRLSDVKCVLAAPLVADERTLGVISVVWPTADSFGEREAQVLVAVARHVAIALLAAESRETVRREAAKKAAVFQQMADAVLVADSTLCIVEANAAAARLFGLPQDALLGLSRVAAPWHMYDADGARVRTNHGPLSRACAGETVAGEYRILTHTGLERWVSTTASPLCDAEGKLTGGVLVLRDMEQSRAAAAALRESEERYRRLVEFCPDPIVVTCDSVIVYANAAAAELAGAFSATDLVGRPMLDFIPEAMQDTVMDRSRSLLELGADTGSFERLATRLNGEQIFIESTTMPITYQGRPAIQAVLRDVTERKRAEAALSHQATHDALTGLPNRVLLLDRLQQALVLARRDGNPVSLLLMDLDRFKEVNDALGHHAGDLLLQQVGIRLRAALRESDTIARLGGDEFAIILPGVDASHVQKVVENVLGRLHSPLSIEQQPVAVGASIGVAVAPDHGTDAEALLRHADVAMYVAKRRGSGFALYSPEHDRNSPDRLSLIGELRRAIDDGDLVLHYQPKLDLATNTTTGVEALVRWAHPLRGLIPPDQFIPVAEQAGLIESLTRWVLRSALLQVNAWRRIGFLTPVAVNLSMRSLHDETLPRMVVDLLRQTGTSPEHLMLEITESSLMVDLPRTQAILQQLREMGIRLAIDDFGTGHSSLAYLKRLPVDQIKIDRSFVKDMVKDATDCVIVRSTIDLGHSLGLRVVAEGVEDATTQELLAALGCDEAQGFHLSRPLPGRELSRWLEATTDATARAA